jgi:hypothetical protein
LARLNLKLQSSPATTGPTILKTLTLKKQLSEGMKQYTVVISDVEDYDTGFRGTRAYWWLASYIGAYAQLSLFWFLTAYFGRSKVQLLRPSELLNGTAKLKTDWLFIGLPTTLNAKHLSLIQYNRIALFDASDNNELNFEYSDRAFLESQTDLCLKNWRDDRWQESFKIGLLPIKRPPWNNRLRMALDLERLGRSMTAKEKRFDVGFVARPTGSLTMNQRLRWLVEITTQRPDLKLWGGLVGGLDMKKQAEQEIPPAILDSLWLNKKKIGFQSYFKGLSQSKVALAPSGYAPWTYRHFEAIYAGCVVVSNDLSHFEFLIPFPRETMVEVADSESVVPAMDRALSMLEQSPDIPAVNRAHLDRWLDRGKYSSRCTDTLDRFLGQIN